MGCLMGKGGSSYYESEIKKTAALADEVLLQIEDRKKLQDITQLKPEETLGYLAYQEQLYSKNITFKLNELFPISAQLQPSEAFAPNLAWYVDQKSLQTEHQSLLISEIFEYLEKIRTKNTEKLSKLHEDIEKLSQKPVKDFPASEQILSRLKNQVSETRPSDTMQALTETFVYLTESEREIALIERIYDFKGFVDALKKKQAEKAVEDKSLSDVRDEVLRLGKTINTMKLDEPKIRGSVKDRLLEVERREIALEELVKQVEELDKDLIDNPDVTRTFEDLLQKVSEREMKMKELQDEVEINEQKLKEVTTELDYEGLRQRAKELKKEMEDTENKIENLKNLKMKRLQDKIRSKNVDTEAKTRKLKELTNAVKKNQEDLRLAEKEIEMQLKKQALLRLSRASKRLRGNAFRIWHRVWIKAKLIPSYEDSESSKLSARWESAKLYDFADELLKEKVRSDRARVHNKKLPKTLTKYLRIYMKRLYKSTNDCEKEIRKMINTIVLEEKTNPTALVLKKMLGVDYNLLYHFDVLLSQLWNEFNYYLIPSLEEKSCLFFDAIKILQDYLNPEHSVAGQKLMYKLKPSSLDDEAFLLLVLKYFMVSYDREFLSSFDSSAKLINFLSDQAKICVNPDDTKSYLQVFVGVNPTLVLKQLTYAVSKVEEGGVAVKKSDFLLGVIEICDEFVVQGKLIVEKMVRSVVDIKPKDFEGVVQRLEPGLELHYIQKLLSECVFDESSNLYSASGESFAEAIIKYGIGGLGIGPFRTSEMITLLANYLRKEGKVVLERRESSDLIKYKINVENIETPSLTSPTAAVNPHDSNILDILPSRNIRIPTMKKVRNTPSPGPGGRTNVPNKFFSSRGNSPTKMGSPNLYK